MLNTQGWCLSWWSLILDASNIHIRTQSKYWFKTFKCQSCQSLEYTDIHRGKCYIMSSKEVISGQSPCHKVIELLSLITCSLAFFHFHQLNYFSFKLLHSHPLYTNINRSFTNCFRVIWWANNSYCLIIYFQTSKDRILIAHRSRQIFSYLGNVSFSKPHTWMLHDGIVVSVSPDSSSFTILTIHPSQAVGAERKLGWSRLKESCLIETPGKPVLWGIPWLDNGFIMELLSHNKHHKTSTARHCSLHLALNKDSLCFNG